MFTNTRKQRGFTLVELMIVIAIIAILAAVAIPSFISFRLRGYNAAALSDARNAYTAAQNLFSQLATATITTPNLVAGGFIPTANVTTTVVAGTLNTLSITSKHNRSSTTYTIDSAGNITSS